MNSWGTNAFLRIGNQVCSTSFPAPRTAPNRSCRETRPSHRRVIGKTIAPDRSSFLSTTDEDIMIQRSPLTQAASTPEFRELKQPLGLKEKRVKAALLSSMGSVDEDEENHPSQGYKRLSHHPTKEELWDKMRSEAWADAAVEPALAPFLYSTILSHTTLEKSLAFLLGNKLCSPSVLGAVQLMGLMQEAFRSDPDIIDGAVADVMAAKDRDPACEKYTQCVLYFKGYQAIQCHRVSHWLWNQGRKALALAFQSRASEVFQVDIHPGAHLGKGILIDHATGVVIGETTIIGDNVSMLHHVTLGGSGRARGEARHPVVGHGVLLGAGVSVLGPIVLGSGSKVGAGSVVVTDLPPHCVAVGVPAKIIKRDLKKEPVVTMDQCYDFIPDYVI